MANLYRVVLLLLLWMASTVHAQVQPVSPTLECLPMWTQAQMDSATGNYTTANGWRWDAPRVAGSGTVGATCSWVADGWNGGFAWANPYSVGLSNGRYGASCPANSVSDGAGGCTCSSGYRPANGQCTVSNQDKDACWNLAVTGTLPGGDLTREYRYNGNIADGRQFCMPVDGMSKPSKGCRVSFKRDAFLDYGGGVSISEGRLSMSPDSNIVDQSCDRTPGGMPPEPPPKEKCKDGFTGTVNGVETCVGKKPNTGADGDKTDKETNDGDTKTRKQTDRSTNCKDGNCTTTITTTTTVTNNITGATTTSTTQSTTTEPQAAFCKENPGSKLCKDGGEDGSSFTGSCSAGFECEGDAIQCSIAREQHVRACKMFDDMDTQEAKLYTAEKGKTGKRTDDLPGNATHDISSGMYSTANMLGGGACITDIAVDVLGTSVTLPVSRICPLLGILRAALLAFGALLWVIIVFRG